jgi:Fe-Mn family superoxide dismutase
MKRRNFIKNIGLGATATILFSEASSCKGNNLKSITMSNLQTLELPSLPYAYDGLEPYMDAKTVEIHYDRHHRTYFNNYVNAIKGTAYENMPIEKVFGEISKAGNAVRNNGGGFFNHVLFWDNLGKGSSKPSAELTSAIDTTFGSFDKLKDDLSTACKTQFGSGWGWLYLTADKNLAIGSTPNQDNPLMDISPIKGMPLLTIDVWEHAYYLKFQNKRADYVDNIWNIINWDEVSRRYKQAMK